MACPHDGDIPVKKREGSFAIEAVEMLMISMSNCHPP
jgi:hypothetical protein